MLRARSLFPVSNANCRRLNVFYSLPRHISTEPTSAPETSRVKFRDRAPQHKSDSQRRPPPRQPRAGKNAPRRLLTPYNLSLQVKQLSKDASVDDAAERVQSVPRDAQNTVVWNTLLNECMKAERWKLAYQLFTDMKRRGFTPNTSTYLTMLGGLATIKSWSNMPSQLENAHSLFDFFMKYVESVKHHDPDNLKELQSKPIAYYMRILATSGQYQRIFDVYYSLTDGPLMLDERVYTSMFNAIYHQLCQSHSSSIPESTKQATVASDAKHVWMQMHKAHKKHGNFEIDDRVLSSAVRALTRGRPSDQTFAFEIIREYLGLAKPGEEPTPGFIQRLSSRSLDAALQLCNAAQKYRLTVHYMRQVMDAIDFSDRSTRELLDATHFQKLLRAHVGLSSLGSQSESAPALQTIEWCMKNDAIYEIPLIRPNLQVYHLLFMTCWRSADWPGALRAFELMTGRNPADDAAGATYPLTVDHRKIFPDPEVMANVLRTALATDDLAAVEQAIALTEAVGVEKLLHRRSNPFYLSRFATALLGAVRRLREADVVTKDQNSRWRRWTASAKEVAAANRNGPTPEAEEEMLGNSRSLAATDDFVAYDMAVRSTKNSRTKS